jgi:hypothetical protein
MRTIMMGVVVLLLLSCLLGSFYMGYRGVGITSAGGPSARQGSTSGPVIIGGGPGSGK